jgi:hypothetical protein
VVWPHTLFGDGEGRKLPDRERYVQLAKILRDLAEKSRETAVRELLIARANEYMLMAAQVDLPPGAANTPVPQQEQQQQKKAEDKS